MVIRALLNTASQILALSLLCSASYANSEEFAGNPDAGFFNQGAVLDMSLELEGSEKPEMQYGPAKSFKIEVKKPEEAKLPGAGGIKNAGSAALKSQEEKIPAGVDPQEYKLKKEFGDPSEPTVVKGVDSSPKPYRAMLTAIDMGRDDLALEYANQWMGYMKSLERVTKKAVAMAGVAKLDPTSGKDQASVEAISNIDPTALNNFMEKRKGSIDQSQNASTIEISDSTRNSISALFGDSDSAEGKALEPAEQADSDPYAKLVDTNIDSESRKQLIRTTLVNELPLDPSANVKVLLFMKPSERASIELSQAVVQAISSPTLAVTLGVVPLSIDGLNPYVAKSFYDQTGMPALLREGLALSKSLNLTQFPALLFVTENSQKAFLKVGKADAVFIEEVANMIGGK